METGTNALSPRDRRGRVSTIVGIETDGGTVLAGDRLHVEGGVEVGEGVKRVFDFETAGAAAVGDPGALDGFRRRLETETRQYRIEHGSPIGIERLARVASLIAEAAGVDAIVSAPDDGSVPRLRSVGRDGSVLSYTSVAFGSGARLALGRLEGTDPGGSLDEAEDLIRELFSTISGRDPETGADVDVWSLPSRDGG